MTLNVEHIQNQIHLFLFEFFCNLVNPNKKKTKKTSDYTKTDVEKNLNENVFMVKDNANGIANFWRSYQLVIDKKGVVTGFVRCRYCNRIDVYDTTKGTRILKSHSIECNALSKTPSIRTYMQKDISITKEEKTELSLSALQFCYKDI